MTSDRADYVKRLLLLCLISLVALTMTQCGENNEESPGDNSDPVDTVIEDEYVDLGLISMTMWKSVNEKNPADPKNGFYTYDEAVAAFGSKLPTMEQFDELLVYCKWLWLGVCYKVTGPNNNYILLPADGFRDCMGGVCYEKTYGFYWSSTPDGSTKAWYLNFYSGEVYMYNYNRCYANSVRLVKNVDED